MSTFVRPILPLSDEVRSQIAATIEIRTLIDAVEQFLRNSIDARATSIDIEVDFKTGHCSVTDDGDGIPAIEFNQQSLLAQAHCTSRYSNDGKYGRLGQALASIAALSLLMITSKERGHSPYAMTVYHSKRLSYGLASSEFHDHVSLDGTQVVIHNLFGNVPVRFKAQSLLYKEPGQIEHHFNILQQRITGYLLASPFSIAVYLKVRGSALSYRCKPTNAIPSPSPLSRERINHIFRQTSISARWDTSGWKLASAKSGDVAIRIAVHDAPRPSRAHQFISFGNFPVHNDSSGSWLYDIVNELFETVHFGQEEDACEDSDGTTSKEYKQSHFRQKMTGRVDRWPSFYIRVDHRSPVWLRRVLGNDEKIENHSSLLQIVELLQLLVKQFLAKHVAQRLHPQASRKSNHPSDLDDLQHSDSKLTSFNTFRRTRSACPTATADIYNDLPLLGNNTRSEEGSFDKDVQLLLDDMDLDSDSSMSSIVNAAGDYVAATEDQSMPDSMQDGSLAWTDPKTGKVIQLNDNSFVIPTEVTPSQESRSHCQCPHRPHPRVGRLPIPSTDRSVLAERLKQWPTQVFRNNNEPRITAFASHSDEAHMRLHHDSDLVDQKLAATDLKNARVLRQVDHKFILAVVNRPEAESQSLLILVDQHAADERIKVEQLYRDLCSGESVSLIRPIIFELEDKELRLLDRPREHFDKWGIAYQQDELQRTLSVTHLPKLIAERCRQEPKILIDILREEIWSDGSNITTGTLRANASVLDHISTGPKGLIELINSRACRNAIMFNDILTTEQCIDLLAKLSKCILPFQCAHGRPSLTVLVRLTPCGFGNTLERNQETFADAYEHWI